MDETLRNSPITISQKYVLNMIQLFDLKSEIYEIYEAWFTNIESFYEGACDTRIYVRNAIFLRLVINEGRKKCSKNIISERCISTRIYIQHTHTHTIGQ